MAVLLQEDLNKLAVLANYVSPSIFQQIKDCAEYDTAIKMLQVLFINARNEIFVYHLLATRRQAPAKTPEEYLQALKTLSKDCNFKNVMAAQYCEEIRDAFITGLQSNVIRQRLLENKTLDLNTMFDQARSLESAVKSSKSYTVSDPPVNAAVPASSPLVADEQETSVLAATAESEGHNCYFCGNNKHPHLKCPACNATCKKKGHFAKVCRSKAISRRKFSAATWSPTLASVQSPKFLSKSTVILKISDLHVKALFDSGSTESFIHPCLVEKAGQAVPFLWLRQFSQPMLLALARLTLSIKNRNTKVFNCQFSQDFVPILYWA